MEGSLACDWCRTRSTFPPKTVIERLTRDRGNPWLAKGLVGPRPPHPSQSLVRPLMLMAEAQWRWAMEKRIASSAALESMVKSILTQHEATKDRRPKIVRASDTRQANWDVVISPPISADAEVGGLLTRQIAELQERFALLD
jgi:hypothetical protein